MNITCGESPRYQPDGAERFERLDVRAGDRPCGASFASRSAVHGCNGAAGTAHPYSTSTAVEILKRGGSAADAAVAAAACLGFLEPTGSGLGGDCYALIWDPKMSKVVGLAGSGRSPKSLSLETVRGRSPHGLIAPYGAIAVSTPGVPDAWWSLHQRYGRLPWPQILEPAIDMCESGVPVPQVIAYHLKRDLEALRDPRSGVEEWANAVHTYAPLGRTPNEGEIFRNPDLARTYRSIADGGRDAFYEGSIALTIDAYFKRIGGWLTLDDLRTHRSEWVEPLVTSYRGVDVYAMGANTQGLATLQMLNILENFDLRGMGFQSADSIHVQAEAKRLAYEDRARHYADPHFATIPLERLNSKAYAAELARRVRPDRIRAAAYPGEAPSRGDTTYLTVADSSGLMVSMIQSNYRGLGSGLVADGLGFMFQSRGQLFSLLEQHPNVYRPGKRPFQTIIPGFACAGGRPWMSFGVMGADMQPQGQTQIVVNRVDYGLDIQAAGDSPRWHHQGSPQTMGEDEPGLGPFGLLRLESGVPERTRRLLEQRGWPIGASDGGFGRYQCVEYRNDGSTRVYAAASEMRADGIALAY
ncbi:MAG TPA: gamma-glutamyltransferase family protein [Steroidobacteraceae bacterium]|jgi:gamma-glutamyltranspeptidase/glutathione hydrolase|nr:gamma-glutamyltransferase family protein [Steroidobacteraceae bacterium]